MTPLLFALCILALIVLAWIRRDRRLDSLPGPPAKYPFIGLGTSLPPKPRTYFREWGQQYGELFTFRLGWYNWVVVNSPEAMKDIFDKQVSLFIFPLGAYARGRMTDLFLLYKVSLYEL